MQQGMTELYYGDGKGKTTAAVGLAVRAAGAGLSVCFVQFLKGRATAERAPLASLGIRLICPAVSEAFVFQMTEAEKRTYAAAMQSAFEEAVQCAKTVDLLVLDEVVDADALGLLCPGALAAFAANKPAGCELVLTGHSAPRALAQLADYITCFTAEKHPFAQGTPARRGIEY